MSDLHDPARRGGHANPVHQRTSRPECAHGPITHSTAARDVRVHGSQGRAARSMPHGSLRRHGSTGTPNKSRPPRAHRRADRCKQAVPPPYAVRPRRPEPCRQPHAGACRAACRLPPGSDEQPGRCEEIRGDALARASAELCRWLCIRWPKVPRHGRRVRPHMYKAAVILVSPGCTCTHDPVGSEVPGGPAGGARQAAR